MDKSVYISLTEFMDYVNSSGTAKATVVANAKKKRLEGHQKAGDYWMQFRNAVRRVHSNNLQRDALMDVVDQVSDDRKNHYLAAVNGYQAFWGRKKFGWIVPPRKIVSVGGTHVSLNPEVGLKYKEEIYYVKLFIHVDQVLDRRHADLILSLMFNKLSDSVPEGAHFVVLDVMRNKSFEYKGENFRINQLLEAEGTGFNVLWEAL